MVDYSELSKYFDDIIEANSNPFFISWSETYKEGGEVKKKYHKEVNKLRESQLIYRSNCK